ncbi:cob(I)yrinic acid a,c-diamide adenosyltransferase [Thermopolyspora flexuosa]|uniref:Corrinoid adenosyltransferase n=1 Tax=Thermopolyspora flexuosa TaxID=103836 RepID=A0A543J1C3_9ACTN|nr:ATP:cob(I)alamin adenosyltransferase [Thermopolyspora flexuosa]GGM85562.1 cob(I)yrinic acid a,c-diamide adenosyltransferase [Thermopolyspora flexuosa]
MVLSRIYTRTGDNGTTGLGDGSRTRKTDPRIAAYADVEEANAAIGVALALGDLPEPVAEVLRRVQNELFDVGADLCTPVVPNPEHPPLRVEPAAIEWLESQCDRFNEGLKPLRSFVLPGGAPGTALLHQARTVVRRAERSAWAALEAHEDVNPLTAKYLNRLSDLLFILCRVVADGDEVLWRPGGTR